MDQNKTQSWQHINGSDLPLEKLVNDFHELHKIPKKHIHNKIKDIANKELRPPMNKVRYFFGHLKTRIDFLRKN